MLQHYINHISLVVDKSGSMSGQPVVKVFDKELEYLKQRSIELDQETRISIYLFDNRIECLTFDMDVMRFKSLQGYYKIGGQTALLDAVAKSTQDNLKLPELYGDHAFLQYVITDGQENASRISASTLKSTLDGLPSHWTTACLVPDIRGKHEAKKFGFSNDSIAIWDTSAANAFERVGKQFSSTIDNYMVMRSKGVRGTTSLFNMDASQLAPSKLEEVIDPSLRMFLVGSTTEIKDFVESKGYMTYKKGMAYYQPTKAVVIQDFKDIIVQSVKTGKFYTGDNIRSLLGLPTGTVEVTPAKTPDWRIFVQSTSTNRKLFPNTFVLVKDHK